MNKIYYNNGRKKQGGQKMMYVKIETANDNYNLMVQRLDDIYDFIDRYNIKNYDVWVSHDNISFWDICDIYSFL